ncbi:MAG: TPM domain-containing protein [Opitutaceae bacterium]|nr:TPM domain-containing protein [Verrucomicrobiales bacterium]
MKPKEFIDQLDDARIVSAIAAAELRTSGEIRVYVSHKKREDAVAAAQARFLKLGMVKTRERNAVLIYFAPLTQQFAIWGDVGVHEKCGQSLWSETAAQMTPLLKGGQYTEAVIEAVQRVGDALARHFPRSPDDKNELPDHVDRD